MIREFLLYHWGTDANKSGLARKVNWRWFWYDVVEVAVASLGLLAAGLAILFAF